VIDLAVDRAVASGTQPRDPTTLSGIGWGGIGWGGIRSGGIRSAASAGSDGAARARLGTMREHGDEGIVRRMARKLTQGCMALLPAIDGRTALTRARTNVNAEFSGRRASTVVHVVHVGERALAA